MITKEEVQKVQQQWGEGVVKIGSLMNDEKECKAFTENFLKERYAFHKSNVLFKPTKTAQKQFRPTQEGALSYFIVGNGTFSEDGGFALQPWTNVRFENNGFILEEKRAIAMGNYFFTDLTGGETKVEYTFGYTPR
ncbi:hypothetical protein [Subsaximicrobium wynnwilliamsii]|uniref:hypothetical protein n=1 Tax=Subsaximicrobium wynnwilliamsii TaxID=291179 RepID=UPI001CB890A1|nr:hypothetical protein [Subsaximicrobium wynnwilliamsii]